MSNKKSTSAPVEVIRATERKIKPQQEQREMEEGYLLAISEREANIAKYSGYVSILLQENVMLKKRIREMEAMLDESLQSCLADTETAGKEQ